MKDCGCEDCYSCNRNRCINECYNSKCSCREEIPMVSNGCVRAFECMGFISRTTYLERQKNK